MLWLALLGEKGYVSALGSGAQRQKSQLAIPTNRCLMNLMNSGSFLKAGSLATQGYAHSPETLSINAPELATQGDIMSTLLMKKLDL